MQTAVVAAAPASGWNRVPGLCRYALVLVQREAAKNELMLVAFDIEGAEASAEAASGDRRQAELQHQVWDAESELNKAQADGPANHRKRDFLDKVWLAHLWRKHHKAQ